MIVVETLQFAMILREVAEGKRPVKCVKNSYNVVTGGKGFAEFIISDDIKCTCFFKGNNFSYVEEFTDREGNQIITDALLPDDVIKFVLPEFYENLCEKFQNAVEIFDADNLLKTEIFNSF